MGANFFPLLLIGATAFTGAVWLLEIFVLAPRREPELEQVEDSVPERPAIVEYSVSFFPVILIVLLFRSFLLEPFQIPSGSMIPTLHVGDFIVVNKFSYGIRLPVFGTRLIDVDEPKNGEVMVFIPPHQNEYFIKRVIGIPGDTVTYDQKKVLNINGESIEQTFVAGVPPNRPRYLVHKVLIGDSEHFIHTNGAPGEPTRTWNVPGDRYFMMGDNRDQSADSRRWSFASDQNIIGKAFAIWIHKDPGFKLPTFKRNGLIP